MPCCAMQNKLPIQISFDLEYVRLWLVRYSAVMAAMRRGVGAESPSPRVTRLRLF